jgi:hypothetical protein
MELQESQKKNRTTSTAVKVTRFICPRHKDLESSTGTAHSFLTSALDEGELSSLPSGRFRLNCGLSPQSHSVYLVNRKTSAPSEIQGCIENIFSLAMR